MKPLTKGSKYMIRSNRPDLVNSGSAPYIVIEEAGGPYMPFPYSQIWNDKGSDAVYSVAFYRPQGIADGYYLIGDYAQNNYDPPTTSIFIASVVNDDPNDPVLAPPQGYNMMWSTAGTNSDAPGSIWEPIAPSGYGVMGWVAQAGVTEPNISNYRCLRLDFLELYSDYDPIFIWDDRRSGADQSIALYTPDNLGIEYPFFGQSNYRAFDGTFYGFNFDRVQVHY